MIPFQVFIGLTDLNTWRIPKPTHPMVWDPFSQLNLTPGFHYHITFFVIVDIHCCS